MKGENFIYVAENVITSESCQKVIDTFEHLYTYGMTFSRQQMGNYAHPENKKDMSASLSDMALDGMGIDVYELIANSIKDHVLQYIQKFEVGMTKLNEHGEYPIIQQNFKVQRTKPSEGYHVWHSENQDAQNYGRFLTWILYLNNIEEGGETELLHLSERIKPKEGRLVIFPAGWTHTHRGNPPLSNTKYIVTGWMAHQ